jgi:photosystem II stability/assembly factor-like uncharacterized protein
LLKTGGEKPIDWPVIRVTADGGKTWRAQHAAGTNGLSSVAFTDDRHGWAIGVHNLLLATTDGGQLLEAPEARRPA